MCCDETKTCMLMRWWAALGVGWMNAFSSLQRDVFAVLHLLEAHDRNVEVDAVLQLNGEGCLCALFCLLMVKMVKQFL